MKFFTYTSLAILSAPSCLAFYPYSISTNSHTTTNPSQPQRRHAKNPHLRFPLKAVRRANGFPISKANPPSQANSAGVNQDGSDLSYMIEVQFGSGKKPLNLLLDSAAVNTWIMGSSCTTDACSSHNTYGSGDSSSLQAGTDTFSISYGTGSVSGKIASDTVNFLSKSFSMTFGLADTVSSEFSGYPMDGIAGVGRLENAANNQNGVKGPTIVDALASQKIITSKQFGLRINRASDNSGNNGEINFGGPDTSAYSGDLNFIPALKNDRGFWEIPVGGASFGGKSATIQSGATALIDSGTSYMLLPASDADAVHGLISGFKKNGEVYTVPCNTNTPITITLGGKKYDISPKDYIGGDNGDGSCTSNIVGRATFQPNQWLVGDVFLKNVYTVFDYDGGRVGFGSLKGSSVSSSLSGQQQSFPISSTTLPPESSSNDQSIFHTNTYPGSSPTTTTSTSPPTKTGNSRPVSSKGTITTTSRPVVPSSGSSSKTSNSPDAKQTGAGTNSASSFSSNTSIWVAYLSTITVVFTLGFI